MKIIWIFVYLQSLNSSSLEFSPNVKFRRSSECFLTVRTEVWEMKRQIWVSKRDIHCFWSVNKSTCDCLTSPHWSLNLNYWKRWFPAVWFRNLGRDTEIYSVKFRVYAHLAIWFSPKAFCDFLRNPKANCPGLRKKAGLRKRWNYVNENMHARAQRGGKIRLLISVID